MIVFSLYLVAILQEMAKILANEDPFLNFILI